MLPTTTTSTPVPNHQRWICTMQHLTGWAAILAPTSPHVLLMMLDPVLHIYLIDFSRCALDLFPSTFHPPCKHHNAEYPAPGHQHGQRLAQYQLQQTWHALHYTCGAKHNQADPWFPKTNRHLYHDQRSNQKSWDRCSAPQQTCLMLACT